MACQLAQHFWCVHFLIVPITAMVPITGSQNKITISVFYME